MASLADPLREVKNLRLEADQIRIMREAKRRFHAKAQRRNAKE